MSLQSDSGDCADLDTSAGSNGFADLSPAPHPASTPAPAVGGARRTSIPGLPVPDQIAFQAAGLVDKSESLWKHRSLC